MINYWQHGFNSWWSEPRAIEFIDKGGYGAVWRGEMPDGRPCAVKFLVNNTPENREDFRREVERLEEFADIRCVVNIYGKNLAAETPYFCMELLGAPITSWKCRLNREQQYELLWQLIIAYEELAKRGVYHRDLNPRNILTRDIGGRPEIVFVDFGISRSVGTSRPCRGTGTPAYTDPLVLAGGGFWVGADIYSIGMTMYEIITGEPKRPLLGMDISAKLNNLLSRMTDPNPWMRPSLANVKAEVHEARKLRASPIQNALVKASIGELALGAIGIGLLAYLATSDS